jgi:excisionase family DNA binding protein
MKTLDIEQCAAFLRIHKVTAYEMAAKGELPGAKIGRAWVFLEEELINYVKRKAQEQQEKRKSKRLPPYAILVDPTEPKTFRVGGRRNTPPLLPDLKIADPHQKD